MKTFCPMVLFPRLPRHQKSAVCWVFCVVMVSVHGRLVVAPEVALWRGLHVPHASMMKSLSPKLGGKEPAQKPSAKLTAEPHSCAWAWLGPQCAVGAEGGLG